MIKVLEIMCAFCIVLSIPNIIQLWKSLSVYSVINNFGLFIITILSWFAGYYYVDELNLNGSYLISILVVIHFSIFIASLIYFLIKKR